jgi:hypothetical protein
MTKFSVTYERYFPHEEGEEVCDADERGFVVEDVSLREAIEEVGGASEASSWPFTGDHDAWFTNNEYDHDYRTGVTESRSLHMPRNLTPATRRRIARLLGVRIGR